jgi:hypothetical protein
MTNNCILIDPAPMPGYWLCQAIKKVIEKMKNWGRQRK